ncbi:MocR-like pyridoxine biosynthesis transcription factor PdxR [Parageobacillus thermoglucosidasius]|uniref:PLP-dependent aminotransferase family protein n=1 Tax=Parageobacillus thermoglucosidasius TaxID=1426 RepID=A0AB38R243_PARTM|nr:PLP-dependent aminotransferase family protein [Parageobacillus thermoglucosidasius]UOE76525.1 PLP-dependent aminotransferase family protein [Parageobacillus thermoglucosidasius]
MEWRPDRTSKIPLYKQIANYLESRILNGEFPPGSRLPSERDLANRWKVNRSTVNNAFEELRSAGLVQRIIGHGTVVNRGMMGNGTKQFPNWDMYVKQGYYPPNNPLNQKIYQFIRTDEQMINFAIGELSADLQPIKLIQDICSSIKLDSDLGYEHIQGNITLREAISEHMKTYRNIESTPSSILITSGAQQAIHLIIRGLLKPGDAVAIEDPSYAFSLPIFHSEGLNTHLLPVQNEGIDPDQIIALHKRHRLKMLFLNPTYQNPTGTTLDLERRRKILEICSKFGIAIVEDDPYSIIGYDGAIIDSMKSMDKEGVVLYVSSLTKIIASGLRIGWILGPQTVINHLADVKQQFDFSHPNLPQLIAAKLLSSKHFDEHIRRLREGLKIKRDLTVQSLENELKGIISFFVPEGGIHLWCKLNDEEIDENLLFKESLKRGVVFAPGSTLGSDHKYIRFTYGRVETKSIPEGIRRFAQSLKSLIPTC